jgi:hypothetical protein
MPRNNVSQGIHRHHTAASHSTPLPPLRRHIPKQSKRSPPHIPKLLHMPRPGKPVRPCPTHSHILIETSQRLTEPAPKPQSPKRKCPFRIAHMIQALPDAPLLRSIPVQRFIFRNGRKKRGRLAKLTFHHANNVILGDAIDVSKIIRCSFVFRRHAHRAAILAPNYISARRPPRALESSHPDPAR